MTTAAAVLPFNSQKQNPYDHDGRTASVANQAKDWDEEVVPALKKQLMADSAALEKRLRYADFDPSPHEYRTSSRPRPIPKRRQYDEIIQDGLGSDELIPSEWATGSNARFLTAPLPRSQDRGDVGQGAPIYGTVRSAGEAYQYSRSSALQDNWTAQTNSERERSPSSPLDDDMSHVAQARDRARKIGRQREESASTAFPPTSTSPNAYARSADMLEDGRNTPTHQHRLRAVGSRNSLKEKGDRITTPSKIPLPVSGSMDKYATGAQREQHDVSFTIEPASVDDVQKRVVTSPQAGHSSSRSNPVPRQRTQSTPRLASKTKGSQGSSRYGALQASTLSQSELDEFGPLGGTPKSKQTDDLLDAKGDNMMNEFGMMRSTSNPWDEELLPTVKKRLAQQAMLERDPRLSKVDGLIDTWDKDGMPLSTRSVSSRKEGMTSTARQNENEDASQRQSYRERESALDGDEKQKLDSDKLSPTSASEQMDERQQAMRMKRLTDQLDFGFQASSQAGSVRSSVEDKSARVLSRKEEQARAMDKISSNQKEGLSGHGSHSEDKRAPPTSTALSPSEAHRKGANQITSPNDAEDAGCCKCTIM